MASIITVQAWRVLPFAVVIFLAGHASIPKEVDDAAKVDGATGIRKLIYVTLPLQLPIALVAILFGIVFTATDMAVVYIMTNGGPFNSTQVLSTWAFQQGIQGGSLGEGAAVSLFLLPVLALVAITMLSSHAGRRSRSGAHEAREDHDVPRRHPVRGRARVPVLLDGDDGSEADRRPAQRREPARSGSTRDRPGTTSRTSSTRTTRAGWSTPPLSAAVVVDHARAALPAGYALARLSGRVGGTLGIAIFLTYLVPPTLLFLPLSR